MTADSRHGLIPGWRQEVLRRSTVVIAGVGALGNEVSRLLAMAGVGRLILTDPDRVEASNLSRTILFRKSDIGRLKVDAAAEALFEIASETAVDPRPAAHLNGVGLADLRDADLVVSCLDSLAARIQLAERCTMVGAGLLDAGTDSWGGEIRYFPAGGPCLACGHSDRERGTRDDSYSCDVLLGPRSAGVSGAVSALIGSWEASTALRLLLGLPVPVGTMSVESAGTLRKIIHQRDPRCPMHDTIDPALVNASSATNRSTVADILAELDTDEEVFAWAPLAGQPPGTRLRAAPSDRPLAALGVAAREVLPVVSRRADRSVRYIELGVLEGPP